MNETLSKNVVKDAYISIEIADRGLECLRDGLRSLFGECGVGCEVASTAAHVSVAYGEGDVTMEALDRVVSEIASLPFLAGVAGFEFLEGTSTPFDYLVVNLDADRCFGAAVEAAQGCMKTKKFAGGIQSHVSLLKFPKGAISKAWADDVLGEMNVCQAAAHALGRRVCLQGAQVSVFGADRRFHFSKFFQAA